MTGKTLFGLAILAVLTSGESQAAKPQPAEVSTYSAPTGESYFALALKPSTAAPAAATAQDHVLLVDTSASQTGGHRRQAFAVVDSFLNSLDNSDRFALFAVDVQAVPVTKGFVAASKSAIQTTMNRLNGTFPAGATNMTAALDAALNVIDPARTASVLYVGDGMSAGNLIPAEDLRGRVAKLHNGQVAFHSYAVGPKTDLELLGVLAHSTGGVVTVDRGDQNDPQTSGRQLAAACRAPVFYVSKLDGLPKTTTLLPRTPLPMRSDRATIYLGRGELDSTFQVEASGTWAGRDHQVQWTVDPATAQPGNTFLTALWKKAEATDGLNVPLAGAGLMNAARRAFDNKVARLIALGQKAAAARNLDQAEQIGLTVRQLDPGNVSGKALLRHVNRLKREGSAPVALLQQPAQGRSVLDDLLGPGSGSDDSSGQSVLDQAAQDSENIQSVIDMRRIKAQQLTQEVAAAIQEARLLAEGSPDSALSLLKKTQGTVLSASDINPDVRRQLLKRLQNSILDTTNLKRRVELAQIKAAERRANLEAQEALIRQLELDEEELEQLIDRVRALMDDALHGNDESYEEAEAVARAAAEKLPGDGTTAAAVFTAEAAGQLRKAFRLRSLRDDRLLETLYQVELSHVPFPDEPPIRWPSAPVWKALTERRKKWASVDLHKNSPSEQRIQEALDDTTEFEFVDQPLNEVVDFLSDLHQITIILDETALLEEGLATDEPITRRLSGITLRSALKIILEPLGLTYIIEDEVMKITTEIAADLKLSTRVYPVADLVIPITNPLAAGLGQGLGGGGGFGGQGGLGGGGQFGQGSVGFGGGGMGGGGFGGGGAFSVPPAKMPAPRQAQPGTKPRKVNDPEIQGILDRILDRKTSQTTPVRGQYFAQVKDPVRRPAARSSRETPAPAVKKKRQPAR